MRVRPAWLLAAYRQRYAHECKATEETVMPHATTLGGSGKAVTFHYSGSALEGVVIQYDYAKVSVGREFFNLALTTFRGRRVPGGFAEDHPTPNGFGEWVRDNCRHNLQPLTPRHASRIAAILVAEGYATSDREGSAVFIKFNA